MKQKVPISGASMTSGNISKQLITFSLPIIATNLLQQLHHVGGAAIVGQLLGRDALAAVGSVGTLIHLVLGLLIGLGNGVGIVVSQYFGATQHDRMKKAILTSITVSIAAGLFVAALGNIISPFMLRVMGFPPYIAEISLQYLRIYFIGAIPLTLFNVCLGIIRATGDSRRPLYYSTIGGTIGLSFVLFSILVLELDIVGVAWATVIGQTISAILALVRLTRLNHEYNLSYEKPLIDKTVLIRMVKIGLPIGLQGFAFALPNLYVQSHINRFGAAAMAGVAAYWTVYGFLLAVAGGLAMATVTFVGQNTGAGNINRIREGAKKALMLSIIVAIATSSLVLLFGEHGLRIFTYDPYAIAYGLQLLTMLTPFFVLFALSEVLSGVIRGVGKTTQAMIIAGVGIGGVRVIWLSITTRIWDGIDIVFMAFPIAWVTLTILTLLYYRFGKWWRDIAPRSED